MSPRSIVIQHLQENFHETAIVFHIVDIQIDILSRTFFKQLAQGHPAAVIPIFEPVYKDHQRKDTRASERELQQLVREPLKLFKKTYIILDALEELPDDTRANLPTILSLRASLLVASRPLQLLDAADAIVRVDSENQKDIELYIDKHIEETGRLRDLLKARQDVWKKICARLKKVSRGMYVPYFRFYLCYSRVRR